MNGTKAVELAGWLNGLGNDRVRDAVPVTVAITYKGKTETFYGARYTWVGQYTENMDGVRSGKYKVGDEYTKQVFYMLGLEPKTAKRKIRVAGFWEHRIIFNLPNDDGDWYFGGGFVKNADNAEYHKHHPFGSNWSLTRWPHEDIGRIDQYDASDDKHIRLAIVVAAL